MTHIDLFTALMKTIKETVDSDAFLEEFRVPKHFIRKRLLSMRQMVMFLLFHSLSALDTKIDQFREKIPAFNFPKVSKQAVSKARMGIRFELFKELFYLSSTFYYENISERRKWKGKYHLFAIDGSDQEVPGSKSVFEEFGKQSDKKNPTLCWSMALASSLYDVLEDIIVDASLQKQFTGERELAISHLSRLTDLQLQDHSIVIFDRGYFSAEIYYECLRAGCGCLMRLRKSSLLCRLKGNDKITTIYAPDGTQMPCRVLKVLLSSGETEYLITSIMDKDLSNEDFCELYFERWKIETKYYELKEHWKIEEFSGNSTLAVRQDFFITLLHANLAAIIKTCTDKAIRKNAKPKNRYEYQTRRTYLVGKVQGNFVKWLRVPPSLKDVWALIKDAAKKRSQIQPGRTSERKRHTRARKHYSNRKAPF